MRGGYRTGLTSQRLSKAFRCFLCNISPFSRLKRSQGAHSTQLSRQPRPSRGSQPQFQPCSHTPGLPSSPFSIPQPYFTFAGHSRPLQRHRTQPRFAMRFTQGRRSSEVKGIKHDQNSGRSGCLLPALRGVTQHSSGSQPPPRGALTPKRRHRRYRDPAPKAANACGLRPAGSRRRRRRRSPAPPHPAPPPAAGTPPPPSRPPRLPLRMRRPAPSSTTANRLPAPPASRPRCTANQCARFSVCPALMERAGGTPRLSANERHFRFCRGGDVTGRGHVRAASTWAARELRPTAVPHRGVAVPEGQHPALGVVGPQPSVNRLTGSQPSLNGLTDRAGEESYRMGAAILASSHSDTARVRTLDVFICCLCSFINTCDIENVTTIPKK